MATKKVTKKKVIKKKTIVEKTALQTGTEMLQKVFKSKKLTDPVVCINEDSFKHSLPHLPTGSMMVDYLIGGKLNRFGIPPCPGLPKGKVINLYGRESAGKTTLALTATAQTIANGGQVAYIDWENAIVSDYAKALGVPIEKDAQFKLFQPSTLEEGLMVIWALAKAGVQLIVIDSVGAGVPKAVMEQTIDEKGGAGRIGAMAAMWSVFLPQLRSIIARTGSCILGISQLRANISLTSYGGDGQTTQGGAAWKFYSDVRMGMIRIKSEKIEGYDPMKHSKEKLSSGAKIRVRADKCKVSASQGRDVELYIKNGEGIDDLRSVIEYGGKNGILRKEGGGWYSWERGIGEVLRIQGLEKFKELIRTSEGAYDELYDKVIAKVYSSDAALVDPNAPMEEDDAMAELEQLLSGKNTDGTEMVPVDAETAKVKDAIDGSGAEGE